MLRRDSRAPLAIACLCLAITLGAQQAPPPDPIIRENATVKLGKHTYVIPDGNVPLVPNVGIVVGTRGTLVIDPGLGRENGEIVLREVAKVSKNTELYIASTHFHPEHTSGYLAFPPTARYVNAKAQEAEFEESGMKMIQMFAGRSPRTAELLKDAGRRRADVTFDREHVLDLGGVRVRCLLVGPTHTRGDTGFFVEQDAVSFTGDVVMNESFLAAGGATSMKAWLAAFDTFEALKPRTIVPAHGEVGPGTIIATNREIMLGVRARALALKAEGRPVDEAAKMVQEEFQAKHPKWPRANGLSAAARSAYNEG